MQTVTRHSRIHNSSSKVSTAGFSALQLLLYRSQHAQQAPCLELCGVTHSIVSDSMHSSTFLRPWTVTHSSWWAQQAQQHLRIVAAHVRSTTLCNILSQCQVPSVESQLRSKRLRWYGHVCRQADDRLTKCMMFGQVKGPGHVGKPRKIWICGLV